MQKLGSDLFRVIALKLSLKDLLNFCLVCKTISNSVLDNENFWRMALKYRRPNLISNIKNNKALYVYLECMEISPGVEIEVQLFGTSGKHYKDTTHGLVFFENSKTRTLSCVGVAEGKGKDGIRNVLTLEEYSHVVHMGIDLPKNVFCIVEKDTIIPKISKLIKLNEEKNMNWHLLGNIDYDKSVWTKNVFCPNDYKNVKGYKQKIDSLNLKRGLNLKIVKIKVMGHIQVCGLHNMKIIGSYDSDKLYYDDYYCKRKSGCYLKTKDEVIDVIFIVNGDNDSEIYDIKAPWFSFLLQS